MCSRVSRVLFTERRVIIEGLVDEFVSVFEVVVDTDEEVESLCGVEGVEVSGVVGIGFEKSVRISDAVISDSLVVSPGDFDISPDFAFLLDGKARLFNFFKISVLLIRREFVHDYNPVTREDKSPQAGIWPGGVWIDDLHHRPIVGYSVVGVVGEVVDFPVVCGVYFPALGYWPTGFPCLYFVGASSGPCFYHRVYFRFSQDTVCQITFAILIFFKSESDFLKNLFGHFVGDFFSDAVFVKVSFAPDENKVFPVFEFVEVHGLVKYCRKHRNISSTSCSRRGFSP